MVAVPIGILLSLLAFMAYWYFFLYPAELKGKIVKGMAGLETGKLKGEINLTQKEKNYKIALEGYFNSKDDKNRKADLKVILDLPFSQEIDLKTGASVKIVGEKAYGKLDKVPDSGIVDMSSVKDKWVMFDSKGAKKLTGQDAENTKLTQSDMDKLIESTNLFERFEKVKDENVEGVECYKFDFELKKEKIVDFFVESYKAQNKDIKEEETKTYRESLSKSLEDVSSIKGSISSGKKDYIPRRIQLGLAGKDSKMELNFKFYDIGKEESVEEPKDYIDLEEAMSGVLGTGSGNTEESLVSGTQRVENQKLVANAKRIKVALEDCFTDNKKYPILDDVCMKSKFDGGIVPRDNISLEIVGEIYTLKADLTGEEDYVITNKP